MITFLMTVIHFSIEYRYTKVHIEDELKIVAKTFQPSLQNALWDLNFEQVKSISNGILNMPFVYGVIIKNPDNSVIVQEINDQLTLDNSSNIQNLISKIEILMAQRDIYLRSVRLQ